MPPEEVVLAQAFPLEALMHVLERKGVIGKAEVLEEIKMPFRNVSAQLIL